MLVFKCELGECEKCAWREAGPGAPLRRCRRPRRRGQASRGWGWRPEVTQRCLRGAGAGEGGLGGGGGHGGGGQASCGCCSKCPRSEWLQQRQVFSRTSVRSTFDTGLTGLKAMCRRASPLGSPGEGLFLAFYSFWRHHIPWPVAPPASAKPAVHAASLCLSLWSQLPLTLTSPLPHLLVRTLWVTLRAHLGIQDRNLRVRT